MDIVKQFEDFLKGFDVPVPEGVRVKGRRLFLVPDELEQAIMGVKLDFFSVGLPLGEATSKGFVPSFALLDLIKNSSNAVIISDEAEWMFVCGRDVFEENVMSDHSVNKVFLVQNRSGEVLGLGVWFMQRKKRMVKAVLDRGNFLRRERKKK